MVTACVSLTEDPSKEVKYPRLLVLLFTYFFLVLHCVYDVTNGKYEVENNILVSVETVKEHFNSGQLMCKETENQNATVLPSISS